MSSDKTKTQRVDNEIHECPRCKMKFAYLYIGNVKHKATVIIDPSLPANAITVRRKNGW